MRYVQDKTGLLAPDRHLRTPRLPQRQRGFIGSGIGFWHKHVTGADPTLRGSFAKWNFEDALGSTSAADSSGNGHAITSIGPNCTFGNTSVIPSGRGTSIKLPHSGSTDYLQLPSGFISALKAPFSIVTFARFNSVAGAQQLFCSQTNGINWYLNNGAMILGKAGVSNNATDSRTLSANTNYMLAVTCSATGTVYFYVNKVASSAISGFPTALTGLDPARIGDYPGNTGQYLINGYLQRYALSNVELSGSELSSFYDALS